MKVIHINAVCGFGSTGAICQEITNELINQGHEGLILYGNSISNYPHAICISSGLEVKLHSLLSRITGNQDKFSYFSTKKILKEIDRFSPDIVHIHNLHGSYVNLSKLFSGLRDRNIKTVITLHDCWFYTGKCSHYDQAQCQRWKSGCGNCTLLKKDIPSYIFDKTSKMWQDKKDAITSLPDCCIIAVSDWIKAQAEMSFLNKWPIKRIYNWIDSDIFNSGVKCEMPQKSPSILVVSAKWQKNSAKFQDLLRLRQLLPSHIMITMVGRLDKGITLPENIRHIEYVSDKFKLAEIYKEADVYVHLSREDSFGKVIIESLACATPVIVYNKTACPELVTEGCGYIVEAGDVMKVSECVKKIILDTKQKYQKACVERAKAFDKKSLINDTIALYKQMSEKK